MDRIFHHYNNREDYHAGLYGSHCNVDDYRVEKCAQLLSNDDAFYSSAKQMVDSWPISTEVNLSDRSHNRQAWIGQATCCFIFGVPDYVTIWGWKLMPSNKRVSANNIADRIMQEWEMEREDAKTLFGYKCL